MEATKYVVLFKKLKTNTNSMFNIKNTYVKYFYICYFLHLSHILRAIDKKQINNIFKKLRLGINKK